MSRCSLGHILAGCSLLFGLLLVPLLVPVWRVGFCVPSGILAATFLGTGWELSPEGVRVLGNPAMHVTLACSGARFFVLMTALFVGLAIRYRVRSQFWLLILPATYFLTLAANISRLILGWYAALAARTWLPLSFHAGFHMLTGMLVFVPVMLLVYGWIQRRLHHV